MTSPEDMASQSREELLALVAQLQRQVRALQAQVAQLATDNQELLVEVECLTRQSKRQATPFSKGTRTKHPTRPGRKLGQGTFSFRQAPSPEEITQLPVNVPVTRESCPRCGGKLIEQRVDLAYVTDLPPLPQPRVTQYRVGVCRCTSCGRQVRGEHPDLAPDQYGATAHRLGTRAKAVAHILHYQVGIPVRKVPLVLELLAGLELTQGGITQDALRWAKGSIGQKYQELRAGVRESPVVYTDDTSWKVGGESAHLMAFDTDLVTVYQVRPRHRHQEVLDRKKGRARDLAVRLWEEYHYGDREEFDRWAPEVRLALSYHLRDRPFKDQDNQKLLRMLRRYHQRGDLLRFLEEPLVEPTNNRVERVLRPAVIARKVSHYSKTWPGAHALAAFTSIIQTLLKKGSPSSLVEALVGLFHVSQSQLATS